MSHNQVECGNRLLVTYGIRDQTATLIKTLVRGCGRRSHPGRKGPPRETISERNMTLYGSNIQIDRYGGGRRCTFMVTAFIVVVVGVVVGGTLSQIVLPLLQRSLRKIESAATTPVQCQSFQAPDACFRSLCHCCFARRCVGTATTTTTSGRSCWTCSGSTRR